MSRDILIVAHGASEKTFFKTLREGWRQRLVVYCKNEGREAITIQGLPQLFTEGDLSSEDRIIKLYGRSLNCKGRAPRLPDLEIYTVMDIDHDARHEGSYIAGDYLRDVPLGNRITTVYSKENLDLVMEHCGYTVDRNDKTASYRAIAEILEDRDELIGFYNRVYDCSFTNLEIVLYAIFRNEPSLQSKLREPSRRIAYRCRHCRVSKLPCRTNVGWVTDCPNF